MASYQAKSKSSINFELCEGEKIIGQLVYPSWFKFNAIVKINDKETYQVEPKGFWGTTIELKEGDKRLLQFSMNWNGQIVLQTSFNEVDAGYIFKHRGIFNEAFVLTDANGAELLVMKPHLKWKNMAYEYDLSSTDVFENLPGKDILLMTSLHCANYYVSMMSSYM